MRRAEAHVVVVVPLLVNDETGEVEQVEAPYVASENPFPVIEGEVWEEENSLWRPYTEPEVDAAYSAVEHLLGANAPVTLLAFSGNQEALDVFSPAAWHDRIKALAPYVLYGPNYRRHVVDHLRDLSDAVRRGDSAVAYDHLVAAERVAGLVRREED